MERHFAEIKDNIVQRVIVVKSSAYANKLFGGKWVETFPDDPNKNFAINGSIYVPKLKNFYRQKPCCGDLFLDNDLKWKPVKNDLVKIIPEYIEEPRIIITGKNEIYLWDHEKSSWIEEII